MSVLKNFDFESNDIRTITNEKGEIWFVATDIARALGYAKPNNAVNQHCSKGTLKKGILPTAGGMQTFRLINEPDIYALIFGSKLETAERFKTWVFCEVIPSIRKTGKYSLNHTEKIADMKETSNIIEASMAIAKSCGIEGNDAVLFCDDILVKVKGYSIIEMAGLDIPRKQERLLSPTEIGLQLNKTPAKKVNKFLQAGGFQVWNAETYAWELTQKGQRFATLLGLGKQLCNGCYLQKFRWKESIIRELAPYKNQPLFSA
jgi:prophage antirepressor-like protein